MRSTPRTRSQKSACPDLQMAPTHKRCRTVAPTTAQKARVASYLLRMRDGDRSTHKPDVQLIPHFQQSLRKFDESLPLDGCKTLYEVICAYGVARTFKGSTSDVPAHLSKWAVAMSRLQKSWPRMCGYPSVDEIVREVEGLCDVFQESWGSRNLSAASKVWVCLGVPTPIYDTLARLALFGHMRPATYSEYCDAFFARYENERLAYEAAATEQSTEVERDQLGIPWIAMRSFDEALLREAEAMQKKVRK